MTQTQTDDISPPPLFNMPSLLLPLVANEMETKHENVNFSLFFLFAGMCVCVSLGLCVCVIIICVAKVGDLHTYTER